MEGEGDSPFAHMGILPNDVSTERSSFYSAAAGRSCCVSDRVGPTIKKMRLQKTCEGLLESHLGGDFAEWALSATIEFLM